jgi:hypothetical protein
VELGKENNCLEKEKPKQEMNNHKKNHFKRFLFSFFNQLCIFCLFHVHVEREKRERERKSKPSNRKYDEKKKKREPGFTLKKKRRRRVE